MRSFPIFLFVIILSGCINDKKKISETVVEEISNKKIEEHQLQWILTDHHLEGSILIYNPKDKEFYSNNFEWAKEGRLPASTFKIANSIIAIETGVVANDSTLIKWDGRERNFEQWNQDLIFRDAFHFSCVPCYQEVARKIGTKRMNDNLNKLAYGNMKVSASNIDTFWLEGDSEINQYQQIDFLQRFKESRLPISKRTDAIMKRLMVIEDTGDYKLSGKTGWAIRNEHHNGWFVGFVEAKDQVYYFAINIDPKAQFNMNLFPEIRKKITLKALELLNIITLETSKKYHPCATLPPPGGYPKSY